MLNQRTIFAHTYFFGRWVRQAVVCVAVAALTACGGRDGGDSGLTITPEPPGTVEDAARRDPTPIGTPRNESLGVGDMDVFRLVPDRPGTLAIDVTGTAQTDFDVTGRDRNGNPVELDTMQGSIIVFITADHIRIGLQVFVQVSAAPGAGSAGTGSYRLETDLTPDTTATSTPPTI